MHNEKLNFLELVNSLDQRGITFSEIKKFEAIRVLETKNYFYKITAYRKNFHKNKKGKYIDLDFSYLVDLASIDMQVRYWLLNISLDIEHSIKTKVLNLITKNTDEDGFTIVSDFSVANPRAYSKTIEQLKRSRYHSEMYKKRQVRLPIWTLIETMDFGTLCSFVQFYYDRYKDIELKKMYDLCMNAKNIRNSCAHSNVLLLNFFGKKNSLEKVSQIVLSTAKKVNVDLRQAKSKKINDLLSLIYLEKVYASEFIIYQRKKRGIELLERAKRNKEKYKGNRNLVDMFNIFSKIVDFL